MFITSELNFAFRLFQTFEFLATTILKMNENHYIS